MKIAFYTLGCKVNQYETVKLSEEFAKRGFEIVDQTSIADVYVINSCTVTGIADKKSRNFARRSKRINPDAITALIGCYAEVAGDALSEIPEIDIILGTKEKENFPSVLDKYFEENKIAAYAGLSQGNLSDIQDIQKEIPKLQSRSRTYLKIEDGCDRFCSYCIIPYARGVVKSRPAESVLEEAKSLIDKGYKEIILTGINTALYGKDLVENGSDIKKYSAEGIVEIVNRISEIDGDFRIRLSSLEPTVVDAEYVKELIKCEKLCSHLHLSLQSGSDNVLSAMKRRYTMDDYMQIVDVVKNKDPNYAVSTDIIVGFPGESEKDFECSLNAVNTIGFSKIHVFKYSARKGTVAAEMNNKVSEEEKNVRSKSLLEAGEKSTASFLAKNKGTLRQTLFFNRIDDSNGRLYRGLTDNDIEVEYASEKDISNCLIDIVIP